MTALAIIGTSIVAWTICAILRAPLGFQTDRGFFYGVPNPDEGEGKPAAERGGDTFHSSELIDV